MFRDTIAALKSTSMDQVALAVSLACASSACTTEPYDGQVFKSKTTIVAGTGEVKISISGYGIGPSELILVEAWNPANGKFEQISSLHTSAKSSFSLPTSLGMATFYRWSRSLQISGQYIVPPPHYCQCTESCTGGICSRSCPLCMPAGDVTLRIKDASSPGSMTVFGPGELDCTQSKILNGVLADVAAQECGAAQDGLLRITINP